MDKIKHQQHFTELIDSYQNLIFSICCKMTGDYFAAEDLTQETFLSAYRHMDAFSGANEKAYLCRIASNKCIDYLKSAAIALLFIMPKAAPMEQFRQDTAMMQESRLLEKLNQKTNQFCSLLSETANAIILKEDTK